MVPGSSISWLLSPLHNKLEAEREKVGKRGGKGHAQQKRKHNSYFVSTTGDTGGSGQNPKDPPTTGSVRWLAWMNHVTHAPGSCPLNIHPL